jgi:hypothetical protein
VEQVPDGFAGLVVAADVFGCEFLGCEECVSGVADVAALSVGSSDVDEEAGLSLGEEVACVDGDGVQFDVGGSVILFLDP